MFNVSPTVDPQYKVLAQRYKDYIFDDILLKVDQVSFYKSIVPIMPSGVPQDSQQIPLVANSQDCIRVSYYLGTESPGNVTTVSKAVKTKCLSPHLKFRYRVKFSFKLLWK